MTTESEKSEMRSDRRKADVFLPVGGSHGCVKVKGKWTYVKGLNEKIARREIIVSQRWVDAPSSAIIRAMKEQVARGVQS